jgi:acetyl-CoA C-acetyltransferase
VDAAFQVGISGTAARHAANLQTLRVCISVDRVRDERVPVLVGVGQVRGNRERTVEAAREPLSLLLDAVRAAEADGGVPVREADSIAVVKVVSWAYDELAGVLAARVGATPVLTTDTTVGGHWPALLLEQAAARIAAGGSRIALIAGGEAQASAVALQRAGIDPVAARGWSAEPGGPPAFRRGDLGRPAMQAAGLLFPTRVYPLFENALRHARGLSVDAAAASAAELYAAFSRVAAHNPAAWNPQERTAAEIRAVGPGNRMVCEPYPLAVNAMPHVDQAAALVVTSLAVAREHGVPDERIVHVWGGAGAADADDVLARPSFAESAALASALDRALDAAGVTAADLDLVDVYSCFPVVPALVAAHLGLPLTALAGVTGGHSAFGGPLSSYTLHALVAVTQRLRAGARLALVHGNGGYLTHEHALLLGREPHPAGYVGDPEPRDTAGPAPELVAVPDGPGEVSVETATVEHGRDGALAQGFLVARTAAGARFAAATAPGDTASARALSLYRDGSAREIVGRTVRVTAQDTHVVVEETA